MKEDNRPIMVTIRCIAYNQERYIRECLDGFVMQKTNFRFEAIVHDDASTDGTADIIREYAEKYPSIIIPVIETENQYSKHDGSLDRIMDSYTHGKYIAICEGDDYWIDPLKLHKQVAFLEDNPDYGLVYTNHYNRKDNRIFEFKEKGYTDFKDIVIRGGVGTLTACLRTKLYFQYLEEIKPYEKHWLMGDAPIWKYLAHCSKIKFIPDFTAVYRILPQSASHFDDFEKKIAFVESGYDVQSFFIFKYVPSIKEKESLMSIITRKKIKTIFDVLYSRHKTNRIKDFMSDNWLYLDLKQRVICYLKYCVLTIKDRVSNR